MDALTKADSLLRDLTADAEELLVHNSTEEKIFDLTMLLAVLTPEQVRKRSDTDLDILTALAALGLCHLYRRKVEARVM